jgi:hypothetical protein
MLPLLLCFELISQALYEQTDARTYIQTYTHLILSSFSLMSLAGLEVSDRKTAVRDMVNALVLEHDLLIKPILISSS